MKDSMNGKICLVTGGTNGIEKSTAQGLARMGATVIIVGRDAQKTFEVVQEIRATSGNPNVDSLLADLASQQEVRRLAGTRVTANALHPGFTATGFAKNNGKVMTTLVSIFAPLEQVAQKHVTAVLASARTHLGDLAFELGWSKGATMTTEQAITLALS